MGKVYDYIDKHPKATRIWILGSLTVLACILSVPFFLFIPGLLENLGKLHQMNAAGFYGVLALAVVAAACSLIWGWGNGWEKIGEALYPEEQRASED